MQGRAHQQPQRHIFVNVHKMFGVGSTLLWGPNLLGKVHLSWQPWLCAGYVHSFYAIKAWLFCDFHATLPLNSTWLVVVASASQYVTCHWHKQASLTWLVNCLQWLSCDLTCSIVIWLGPTVVHVTVKLSLNTVIKSWSCSPCIWKLKLWLNEVRLHICPSDKQSMLSVST